ncbi:hypothetical protein Rsub_00655 [Raphidocelis subcapitata]|uniref:Uncharacterized protein n=1 Tax=Raphidocelis subcapitata TaxID=307507 RepID=A0A2V0NQW2_9CHLO|nr:hypothetical protein Rsub_00655 [Raphidocelis subcapitata]|eukprot:GBF87943.1 hypothetical protein Rsub_00655 [Raphidocelis subcapitata]
MQPEGQPADGLGGGAALAAQIDAALDAAFAAMEAALEGSPSDCNCVSAASTGAVAELLVRGLSSTDASVARRAALAVLTFVDGDAAGAAASAVAAVSDGAALLALTRLAASGDDAAADAAWEAVHSLLWRHGEDEARRALVQRYAAIDGAVEGLIEAVRARATCSAALDVINILILYGGPELSAQFAAADGFCTRLVSVAAAVGDSPWQPSDDRFESCQSALNCMEALLDHQPAAAAPALMAAEGLWPALEGLVARTGSREDEIEYAEENAVVEAISITAKLSQQSAAAARHAAGLAGLLAGLAAALTQPFFRQDAGDALWAIATHGGSGGKAAVAAAVAGPLACVADDATRQELRDWLAAPPMQMEAGAIGALERMAVEAAALRTRVAELEAIPVNTRAAIVELAHVVRGKRRREEGEEAAAGKEQRR